MGTTTLKRTGQLFGDDAPPLDGERFDTLLAHKGVRIERIVSSSRPLATEYVQPHDEWVALLRGQARMTVAGEAIVLEAGSHLFLPAGTPHTVDSTSDGALWLAVHWDGT